MHINHYTMQPPHSQEDSAPSPFYQNWTVKEENVETGALIGRGASSEVYKAILKTEDGLKQEVAVKRLQMYANPEEAAVQRQEIIFLRQLSHPNIVNFIGVIESPGKPFFIITELASEGSLYDYLQQCPHLQTTLFCDWSLDSVRAIQYLHDREVAHRDIKSLNYLIADKVLKLCDFGIARNIKGTIYTDHLKGSTPWMAPEVFVEYAISVVSDIFSYGIVLWELITCKEPYKGMSREQIMFGVGNDDLRPEIPQDCPEVIRHLLEQCWDADRKKRPCIKTIVDTLEKYKQQVERDQDEEDLYTPLKGDSVQGEDLMADGDAKVTGDEGDLKMSQETSKDNTNDDIKGYEETPSVSDKIMREDDADKIQGSSARVGSGDYDDVPSESDDEIMTQKDSDKTQETGARVDSGDYDDVPSESDEAVTVEESDDKTQGMPHPNSNLRVGSGDYDDVPSDTGETMTEDIDKTQESNAKDLFACSDLPPTPPEEWEKSEDRLGGKLYEVTKNFKARLPYEISVKKGELVELTEIDLDDGSWHVRVTLGTSLDGYIYTKRVGWVPPEHFAEYTGPDKRKSRSLTDVSYEDTLHDTDNTIDESDKRLSTSIPDITDEFDFMTASSISDEPWTYMSCSTGSEVSDSKLFRRTGSWLGGTYVHHHLGHQFQASRLHVPVRCSFCKKWCTFSSQEVCEYQCLTCKLVVHKGCHDRILNRCRFTSNAEQCPLVNEEDENENERLSIDLPHRFLVHTWKTPTRCSHCGGLIIGLVRQGLKCAECSTNIHHKCKPHVPNSCSIIQKDLVEKLNEVKKARSREKKKSTIKVITNQYIS